MIKYLYGMFCLLLAIGYMIWFVIYDNNKAMIFSLFFSMVGLMDIAVERIKSYIDKNVIGK